MSTFFKPHTGQIRLVVFALPRAAMEVRLWILLKSSSVIFLHLLSMNAICAASHNSAICRFPERSGKIDFNAITGRPVRDESRSSTESRITFRTWKQDFWIGRNQAFCPLSLANPGIPDGALPPR